jgi:transcriptional regulator with XRE-family HTH domain
MKRINKFRKLIKKKGLRLVDLSRMTGLTMSWILSTENILQISNKTKKKLAKAFNVSERTVSGEEKN